MQTILQLLSRLHIVGKPVFLGFKCGHGYHVYPPAGISDYDINRAKMQAAISPCRACAPKRWSNDEFTGAYSELHRTMKNFYFWTTFAENLSRTFGMRKE